MRNSSHLPASILGLLVFILIDTGYLHAAEVQYTILKGDTLSEIAQQYLAASDYTSIYGTKTQKSYVKFLAARNNIPNPDLIFAGHTLIILISDPKISPVRPQIPIEQKQEEKQTLTQISPIRPKPVTKAPSAKKQSKFFPWWYTEGTWGYSFINLNQSLRGLPSIAGTSHEFTHFGGAIGYWFGPFGIEASLKIQPLVFPPTPAIDDRTFSWIHTYLDARYAFEFSDVFALSPRIGVGYHVEPYVFVQNATSIFMTSNRHLDIRAGLEAFVSPLDKFWFSIAAIPELPIAKSASSNDTLSSYKLGFMMTGDAKAAFRVFPWMDFGGQITAHYHRINISRSDNDGVVPVNNAFLDLLNINVGLFIRVHAKD